MTQYIFKEDFPPTSFKKGEIREFWDTSRIEVALMLKLGVIEEVKEEIRTGQSIKVYSKQPQERGF